MSTDCGQEYNQEQLNEEKLTRLEKAGKPEMEMAQEEDETP